MNKSEISITDHIYLYFLIFTNQSARGRAKKMIDNQKNTWQVYMTECLFSFFQSPSAGKIVINSE